MNRAGLPVAITMLPVALVCFGLGLLFGSVHVPGTSLYNQQTTQAATSSAISQVRFLHRNTPRTSSAMAAVPQIDVEQIVTAAEPTRPASIGSTPVMAGLGFLFAAAGAAFGLGLGGRKSQDAESLLNRRAVLSSIAAGGLGSVAGAAQARGQISNEPEPEEFDRTTLGITAAVLGVALGVGAPTLYNKLEERDQERLAEIRDLNKKKFKETGETLTDEEIADLRPGRWSDRREFADDD